MAHLEHPFPEALYHSPNVGGRDRHTLLRKLFQKLEERQHETTKTSLAPA
jgi:hypothetical protein